jgi:ATP-binding cassette, subfamily B (MDR/TAP), member 1
LQGAVEIKHVFFSYPARPDVQVLRDLSLNITVGHTVALVGPSGCGKSTVVQLLQRFYDPVRGSVGIDGRDIRELSLRWYRDQVGLVSQEPTLFATSIKENIAMGKPGATDKEIEAAAESANAASFIRRLPEKFDTKVCIYAIPLLNPQYKKVHKVTE